MSFSAHSCKTVSKFLLREYDEVTPQLFIYIPNPQTRPFVMRLIHLYTTLAVALAARPLLAAPGDLLATFRSPSPQPFANFGEAVADVSGQVLVGEPDRLVNNLPFVGAAYLFNATTGGLTREIPSPSLSEFTSFSHAAAPLPNGFAIGTSQSEKVFVFDMDGNYEFTISPPAARHGGGSFGEWLATTGNSIVTADPSEDVDGVFNAGVAYVFDGATGDLLLRTPNPDPQARESSGT
jgi:hypothetical protein